MLYEVITVKLFRSHYPDFNFTTDMIVGFPDESEEEFQQSVDSVNNFVITSYSIHYTKLYEHMPESEIIHRIDALLKFVLALVGKANNHISCKIEIGIMGTKQLHHVFEASQIVHPAHAKQHPVGTTLQTQVQVGNQFRILEQLHKVVTETIRFQR